MKIKSTIMVFMITSCVSATQNSNCIGLWVGTYTDSTESSLHQFVFNPTKGISTKKSESSAISNTSFFVVSQDGQSLWAVSENDTPQDAVYHLTLDTTSNRLKVLNSQLTFGNAPCHVAMASDETFLVTANYGDGSLTLFHLDKNKKILPTDEKYTFFDKEVIPQQKSHLHCVVFTPDNKFVLATDLGQSKIYCFAIRKHKTFGDSLLRLQNTITLPPSSGPRHLTFHPNGKYIYLISEFSGTITGLTYEQGNCEIIETILADSSYAKGSADIHVSPDGKFLYASHRLKNDGISIFKIDSRNGKLSYIDYQPTGRHPRNFIITPDGKYLFVACRDDNKIQIFERNVEYGVLEECANPIQIKQPVCIKLYNI